MRWRKLTGSTRSLSKSSSSYLINLVSVFIGQPLQITGDEFDDVASSFLAVWLRLKVNYTKVPRWRLDFERLHSRYNLLKCWLFLDLRQIQDYDIEIVSNQTKAGKIMASYRQCEHRK